MPHVQGDSELCVPASGSQHRSVRWGLGEERDRQTALPSCGLEFLGILRKGLVTKALCLAVIAWALLQLTFEGGELRREVWGSKN